LRWNERERGFVVERVQCRSSSDLEMIHDVTTTMTLLSVVGSQLPTKAYRPLLKFLLHRLD